MVNHGTLVKIMANHYTWNACQDHGKIMARSCQDNHGKTCKLVLIVHNLFFSLSSAIFELAIVIISDITFIDRK